MSRVDAEAAVLGACLIDPQAYWRIADLLAGEDFASGEHRALWEVIADLRRAGIDADFVTVGEKRPDLAQLAVELSNVTPGSANVRGYAGWVSSAAIERRVQVAGQRIAKLRGDDVLGEAQRILASCHTRNASAVKPIRAFLQESVALMQQRCDADSIVTGVPTSLDWLDEQTGGWQRTDLIVIAARPSQGKTALAIQCALHAALSGHPVFFASLEQSGSQISERAVSHLAGVPLQHILQPKRMEEHEWSRITNAHARLRDMRLMIDETGALPVDAICARARQCNAEDRLGLIVIDYLTQIQPPRADKTADAIQVITRALKALAKELSVPLILLSQLNREGEERPTLRTLRDSGAIEQDADVVVFLHRPDPARRDLTELIIGKQRNGPCESTYLHAALDRMCFLPTEERPTAQPAKNRGFNTFVGRSAAA